MSKGLPEDVNQRSENTMTERKKTEKRQKNNKTNTDLQNVT